MTVYGELVGRHGLAESHRLLLSAVADGSRVLDVGCADGYLGEVLVARGCEVVGVEVDPQAAKRAESRLSSLIVGSVSNASTRKEIDGRFDVVVFGDVLEHLADPLTVLRWAAGIGDRVVVSLPNIAHWTARRQILRGRFPQEDHGLFDRTHLRFFTRATARELVHAARLDVVAEQFAGAPLPLQSRLPALEGLQPRALRTAPELFALQIVLTCAPTAAR